MFPDIGSPRWLAFRNDASETAPAFGVLQPTGFTTESGRSFVKITKPNSTPADFYFLNGPQDVPQGKYGYCTADMPAFALYNTAVAINANQVHGPKSGEWKLFNQKSGFTLLNNNSGVNGRVLVGPAPVSGYAGMSGGGQFTVGAGYTKIPMPSIHVSPLGLTANVSTGDITVDRAGAYSVVFTACVRYVSYSGAAPIMALHRNGTAYLGPSVACQIDINNANYRNASFAGIVQLSAGDVLDVRLNGPQEQIRFQLAQLTVHLVGVA